jgi:hypothetical protein
MSVDSALCPARFESDAAPFLVPHLSERLSEGRPPLEAGCVRRAVVERPYQGHLRGLLRLGGERRGEEAAGDHAKERSSVHYSIT